MAISGLRYRIPVLSSIHGLVNAVQQTLRTATCPASDLFRAAQLELIEIPIPPSTPSHWIINEHQTQILQDARIVLGDVSICAPLLLASRPSTGSSSMLLGNVQWMQATFAGVEAFHQILSTIKPTPQQTFTLTRAGGIMPKAMAQYVLGWIIAIERQFFEAQQSQQRQEWANTQLHYRPSQDVTVGLLGFGDIGQEVGRLLKQAGFNVVAFKRTINVADAKATLDCAHRVTTHLQHVLEQSDFIVNVLPSTRATRHLLNEQSLAVCSRKRPVFINVGRGDVIQEATLLMALDKQWLSKAVLDVFATEPLPQDSRLWPHSRVHITPHVAAISFPHEVANVFIQNLNLFLANEPLQYPVNWTTGY